MVCADVDKCTCAMCWDPLNVSHLKVYIFTHTCTVKTFDSNVSANFTRIKLCITVYYCISYCRL